MKCADVVIAPMSESPVKKRVLKRANADHDRLLVRSDGDGESVESPKLVRRKVAKGVSYRETDRSHPCIDRDCKARIPGDVGLLFCAKHLFFILQESILTERSYASVWEKVKYTAPLPSDSEEDEGSAVAEDDDPDGCYNEETDKDN